MNTYTNAIATEVAAMPTVATSPVLHAATQATARRFAPETGSKSAFGNGQPAAGTLVIARVRDAKPAAPPRGRPR